MHVDIQLFKPAQPNIPASYRLRNPRAGCIDKQLQVRNLWFPVDGQVEGFENAYAEVSEILNATQDPIVLSVEKSILIQRNSSGDSIAAQFDAFK